MVTAGRPYYGRLADIDVEQARRSLDEHLWLPINVARHAVGTVRPGGTLLFMSGTGARRPGPALTANLALELAPVCVFGGGGQVVPDRAELSGGSEGA